MSIGSNDVLKNCVIQAAGAVGIHTEYKQIYPELKARYLEHPAEMTEMLASAKSQTGASGESGSIRYMRSV